MLSDDFKFKLVKFYDIFDTAGGLRDGNIYHNSSIINEEVNLMSIKLRKFLIRMLKVERIFNKNLMSNYHRNYVNIYLKRKI